MYKLRFFPNSGYIVCFLLAFMLAGCEGSMGLFEGAPEDNSARHFVITASDDANNHTPVAIDIAFTSSVEAAQRMSTLSAREYFAARRQLMRDYPHQLMVASWEIIPGHTIQETVQSDHENIVAAYLFVDYNVPGVHRAALPAVEGLAVHLGRSDFTLTPTNLSA